MTLDNEAPDDSEFFSPDDIPASEGAETEAQDDYGLEDGQVEGEDTEQEFDENGDPIAKPAQPDQSADEEFEEIEHAGKKHKIPKDLKPLLMMQQDYTRKTQEVAEQRRTLDEYKAKTLAEINQQVHTAQQFTREYAQIHSIDSRLAEYANVDWKAWEAQDFMAANAGWKEMGMLEKQRAQLAQSLQQKQHQSRQEAEARSREAQQAQEMELAKRREETVRTIQREIPSWNEEVAGKVAQFAINVGGYTPEELRNAATDPRAFILLHKAWRGAQLEAQQTAAARKAKASIQPQAQPLTPVAKGRAAPATTGLDDRLSPEEWTRRRNEQLRRRR